MNTAKRPPNEAAPSLSTPALLAVPMQDTPPTRLRTGRAAFPFFMCHSLNGAAVAGKPVEFFEPRRAQSDGVAAMDSALEAAHLDLAPEVEK